MDGTGRLCAGTRTALLLTALLLLHAAALPHWEGAGQPEDDNSMAELSRQLVMVLLARRLEMAARSGRSLQTASRTVTAPKWPEGKLRQKLAELAEEELAAHLPGHRNLHTVNQRPLLESKKRACFWKYCV